MRLFGYAICIGLLTGMIACSSGKKVADGNNGNANATGEGKVIIPKDVQDKKEIEVNEIKYDK